MYLDEAVKNTELFEGRVNHMYLDSKGNVTVAVGLMLPTVAAAQTLPFLKRGMGQDFPATPEEIAEDFHRIRAASVGHTAAYYHQNGVSLYLKDEDMDKQLRFFLACEDNNLRGHFARYDQWPDAAKLAYLDMGYNLGPIRLFREYPHMNAAAASDPPQWLKCAAECGRELGDPAFERRNTWARAQFRAAWATRKV